VSRDSDFYSQACYGLNASIVCFLIVHFCCCGREHELWVEEENEARDKVGSLLDRRNPTCREKWCKIKAPFYFFEFCKL